MTERLIYFGSYGPFFYDDEDTYPDSGDIDSFGDGETMGGVVTDGGVTVAALELFDTNASNKLSLVWNEDDDTDRTLNLLVGGGDRSVTVESNAVISQDYSSDSTSVSLAGLALTGNLDLGGNWADNVDYVRSQAGDNSLNILARRAQANAGVALLVQTYNASNAASNRLTITGGVNTAVATWANITHTGLKLSGTLDVNSQDLTNAETSSIILMQQIFS